MLSGGVIIEQKKFYTCRYDRAFKEIFMKENNKDILIALLESILKIKIELLEYLNLEKKVGNVLIRRKHFDLHVKTDKEDIQIEVNSCMNDYIRPRNMAYLCSTYSRKTVKGEEYNEDIKVIQINLTYGLMKFKDNRFYDVKKLRVYKMMDKDEKTYVNNLIIYELNMDYFMKLWYSKNEKEIDENKYLIMLDLEQEDLSNLSKKDRMVEKYMEEINRVNDDPDFYEYISAEEDNRKIENSLRSQWKREGLAEGRKEGQAETIKNIVLKMLNKNMSIDEISSLTGLNEEEINNIEKNS